MAFQQAQHRPQAPRQLSHHTPDVQAAPPPPVYQRPADEEWILFSPQSERASFSYTSQTPRTATHLSDFGSLETHIRSQPAGDTSDNLSHTGTDQDDEGAELDSLDDGLHAFHPPFTSTSHNALDQSGAVLPTHDGLGTFPSGLGLQEQLWQFERHNPLRRAKLNRRRSSLQRRLDAMDEEPELEVEDERTARIEKWRIEQSRAVLEEIEREARRRRRKMAWSNGSMTGSAAVRHDRTEQARTESPPSESFWRRITRRVIQDLIGLDENTLSVIFGEELVDVDSSPTPKEPSPIATAASQESRVAFHDGKHDWENKLLERIARELGVLVHQLAENDGAAFSTYRNSLEAPIEYAGLPRNTPRQPSLRQRTRLERQRAQAALPATDASFSPTVPQTPLMPETGHNDAPLWGIEEEPEQTTDDAEESSELRDEREYWEQEVDVNMIFTFLKNRFSRAAANHTTNPSDSKSSSGPLPASWATDNPASVFGTSPESLRRAEVIRRQHPLVSRAADRAAQSRRRESILRRHQMHHQLVLQRRSGSSSCASHSTKRSRQHTRSGSSRHFWDFGGGSSVGSGQAAVAAGSWGEV